jgi:hypothetical protein
VQDLAGELAAWGADVWLISAGVVAAILLVVFIEIYARILVKKGCYMGGRNFILAALAALALPWANGCTTMRQTDPARTATEQLLLSTAADRCVKRLSQESTRSACP